MPFDLDQNVNADLAKFANRLKEKAAATPAPNIQVSTQPPIPAAILPTPAVVSPEPESVTPAPIVEPTVTSTEPSPVVEEKEIPWDANLIPEQPKDEPFTLESVSSALQIDGIKTKADLVAQFKANQAKIKELEVSQEQSLDAYDDDLKEVLKIAKAKGDWKQYLGARVVNYEQADPVKLFEAQVELNPRFKKLDGTIDFDAVDRELAEIPLAVRETQGQMLKQNLINHQNNQRHQLLQAAEQRQATFHRQIAEVSRKLPELLSKEKFGIAIEPKHGDFLYDGIRSGTLIEKHLGKVDISGINPEKLAKTLALAEWGESIAKHQYSQGVVKGKKELLAKAQNVQLNTPAIAPSPNQAGDKIETPADKIRKLYNQNQRPGSL